MRHNLAPIIRKSLPYNLHYNRLQTQKQSDRSPILSPPLSKVSGSALRESHLALTLFIALISVVLKNGRVPDHCASYHCISLINVDSKILAKVLTTR